MLTRRGRAGFAHCQGSQGAGLLQVRGTLSTPAAPALEGGCGGCWAKCRRTLAGSQGAAFWVLWGTSTGLQKLFGVRSRDSSPLGCSLQGQFRSRLVWGHILCPLWFSLCGGNNVTSA